MFKKPIVLEVIMPEMYQDIHLVSNTHANKKPYMSDKKDEPINIGSCYGLIEMNKRAIDLKMWCDLKINIMPEGIDFKGSQEILFDDHSSQAKGFNNKKNFEIIKLRPPYFIRCKERVSFVLTNTPFNFIDFKIPTGVLDFYHNRQCNIFAYYPRNIHRTIDIKFQETIAHLVPLSDRKVKLKHIYSDELVNKTLLNGQQSFFYKNGMRRKFKDKLPQYWPT